MFEKYLNIYLNTCFWTLFGTDVKLKFFCLIWQAGFHCGTPPPQTHRRKAALLSWGFKIGVNTRQNQQVMTFQNQEIAKTETVRTETTSMWDLGTIASSSFSSNPVNYRQPLTNQLEKRNERNPFTGQHLIFFDEKVPNSMGLCPIGELILSQLYLEHNKTEPCGMFIYQTPGVMNHLAWR